MDNFEKVPKGVFDKVANNKELFISEFKEKLEEVFPAAVKDGIVDFEALLNEFGQYAETDEKEKYNMTWVGKKDAIRKANEDIVGKTLKYVPEDGKNPDTTQNLYIEGDNLEVLKLLRNSYYGKVKMIYIDPPYNTGNDFVYSDNFSMSEKEYSNISGEMDSDGKRLVANNKESGRFHSTWLNEMYPTIKIAKELLTNDGVIFISIDDNEVYNLRKICNEIFGERNIINNRCFINHIPNGTNKGFIARAHEYILAYAKDINFLKPFIRVGSEAVSEERCTNTPTEKNPKSEISFKKGLRYQGDNNVITGIIGNKEPIYIKGEMKFENGVLAEDVILESSWRNKNQILEYMKNGISYDESGQELFEIYFTKDGKPKYRKRLKYFSPKSVQQFKSYSFEKEFDILNFENPKPVSLVEFLVNLVCSNDDIILDFFSGSATTANAVMKINSENKTKLKYIMVQLPENLDKEVKKRSGKALTFTRNMISYLDEINKPHLLTEVGKERIRMAGDLISDDNVDSGFKVFKVADTNIRWISDTLNKNIRLEDYRGDLSEKDRLDFNPHFTDIDVVYEMMLKRQDIELTERIDNLDDIGGRTYLVGYTVLVCLEEEITEKMVKKISEIDTSLSWIVFRDSAFGDDINLKTNTMNLLRTLIKEKNPKSKNQKILWI
ncbi:site-specific DNA-methyltransferase [Tepidibacter sp. Z1-5]|uniref:site-specific DNA-methyltransferase n=1 Tax=Tepidibacter sp. Z1-5 TaxID=3134138 RepID=UPI0030BD67AD